MLDVAENIPEGTYQHMGDNVVAILEYLLSEAQIESFTESRDYIFFEIMGKVHQRFKMMVTEYRLTICL
jgi:hypothetical protein